MSAFQQSEHHIGAIVRWYLMETRQCDRRHNWNDGPALFDMLAGENVKSLQARYPDIVSAPANDNEWNHPVPRTLKIHDYAPLTTGELVMAVRGYEYQACEHDGWQKSEAYRFCQILRDEALNKLAGDANTWSIDETFGKDRSRPIPLSALCP